MTGDGERSIAAVLTEIVGNVQQIIRAEIRLASLEVRQQVGTTGRIAILLIIGGAIAALAPAFMLLAVVHLLATVVSFWSAALIAAAAAGVVGGTIIAVGMKQMRQVVITPPRTLATMKENIQWAKTSTS